MTARGRAILVIAGAVLAACLSGCGVPVQDQPERLPSDLLGAAFAPVHSSVGQ